MAQAEASGAFKGEPGKDGVVSVTGAAVGQTVKITAVDENGNPTEWEATDFPESSTQTDWNQNDESAPDYVKNRPFYEKNGYVAKWVGEEAEFVRDFWYKVSDTVVYLDEIIGKACECPKQGVSINLTSDVLVQKEGYITWYTDYYQDSTKGLFVAEEITYAGHTFTPGIYIYGAPSNNLLTDEWYIGRDYFIKTLDHKYIKDMYHEEENIVDIAGLEYETEVGTYSTTYTIPILPLELGQKWNAWHNSSGGSEISLRYENLEVQVDTDGELYIGDLNTTSIPFYIKGTDLVFSSSFISGIQPTIFKIVGASGTYTNEPIIHYLNPKYIKDMYHEESVELFSVENATFDGNPYFPETPIVIEDGNTYIVNWDGVEYTCEAYIFEGIPTVGNTAEFGGKGNGEPFCIIYDKYENVTFVGSFDDLATHTFSVAEMVRHTIAPKYIKDMYYEEENLVDIEGLTYSLAISNIKASGSGESAVFYPHGSNIPLALGQTWFIDVDINRYTREVRQADDGALYLGSHPDNVDDTPFCITSTDAWVTTSWNDYKYVGAFVITGVSGTYTDDPIVHQIDTKYLPILEEDYETIFKANVTDFIELTGPEYGKLLGKYIVVIDGVSKTVEFIDDGVGSLVETDSFFIESWTDPEGNVDNNGFVMGFLNPDGTTRSVKIARIKDVIKEEYLPNSVISVPDWS